MRHERSLAASLAAAAVLVGGGGCGGGDRLSKAEYEEKMQEVGASLERSFEAIGDNPDSLDQLSEALGKSQDELREAADELEDVEPPENVEDAHDDVVDGLRGVADQFGELVEATEEGDPEEIEQFMKDFEDSDAAKKLQSATEEIKSKGYKIEE
jgi:hypothetical protein